MSHGFLGCSERSWNNVCSPNCLFLWLVTPLSYNLKWKCFDLQILELGRSLFVCMLVSLSLFHCPSAEDGDGHEDWRGRKTPWNNVITEKCPRGSGRQAKALGPSESGMSPSGTQESDKQDPSSGRREPEGRGESREPHAGSVRASRRSRPRRLPHARLTFNLPRRKTKEGRMGAFVTLPRHPCSL